MKKTLPLILMLVFSLAFGAEAQNEKVREARFPWTVVSKNLLKMAEAMPAESYGFKPAAGMETFAQRVAHIAGANSRVCTGLTGSKPPSPLTNPAKPELVALLRESNAACDAAFDSVTDATAFDQVSSRLGGPFPPEATRSKLATLNNMVRHSNEMYGYMSVYLRLQSIVPPSSLPE